MVNGQRVLTTAINPQSRSARPATTRSSGKQEDKNTDESNDKSDSKISQPGTNVDKILSRLKEPVTFPRTDSESRFDEIKKDGSIVQANDTATLERKYGLSPSPGFYHNNSQAEAATPQTGSGSGFGAGAPIVNNFYPGGNNPWQNNHGAQMPPHHHTIPNIPTIPSTPQTPIASTFRGEVNGTDGQRAGQLVVSLNNGQISGLYRNADGSTIDISGRVRGNEIEVPINGQKIHGIIDQKTGQIQLAHLDECKECKPNQELPPRIELPPLDNRNPQQEMMA